MYNINDYGEMIADKVRMDPYAYALKAAIKPDSVVLDIGAATGIHALLACKFGAKKVYAVEANDAIFLAQELAQENGFADRIEFIHNLSTELTLPEQATVVVSDLRGFLPLFGYHIPSIIDARRRHLAPGGLLIPKRDTLWTALVTADRLYNDMIGPWALPYGLSMTAAKQIALNKWTPNGTDTILKSQLLSDPQLWAMLDYATIEDTDVEATIVSQVTQTGLAHGHLIWFDAEIADGLGFSNDPRADKMTDVYGRGFFPLLDPVKVFEGDAVILKICANLNDGIYVWQWHTQIHAQGDLQAIKADFVQSTEPDNIFSGEHIAQLAAEQRPLLNKDAEVDRFVLGFVNGRNSIATIAQQTQTKFPERFRNQKQAMFYVYELTKAYQ